jgi:ADP-ribose pyrophosphatase
LHGVLLAPRRVPIAYGLIEPSSEYQAACNRLFPHGEAFAYGGCMVREARWKTVLSCPLCWEARVEWLREQERAGRPEPELNEEAVGEPRLLFRGEHLDLLRRQGWEYAEHRRSKESVMIVAITSDRRLILVEEFRPSVNAPVISLPAGLAGDDRPEDPREAAERELREETGYAAPALEPIGRGPGSAGASSEMVLFYLARDARRAGEQSPEDRGIIRVHAVPIGQLRAWTREREAEGALVDPKIWAGLYLAGIRNPTEDSGLGTED